MSSFVWFRGFMYPHRLQHPHVTGHQRALLGVNEPIFDSTN